MSNNLSYIFSILLFIYVVYAFLFFFDFHLQLSIYHCLNSFFKSNMNKFIARSLITVLGTNIVNLGFRWHFQNLYDTFECQILKRI